MNRDESNQAATAASIDQDPVTVKPIGGEYGFPGWHTVLLGGKALRHFSQQDAADRYAEGVRVGRDSVEGADPGLTSRMATALTGALNYIEHSHANRGKATSDAEWDVNVAAFRKQGVSQLGIGRSYTDKAQVDLALCREVLAEYGGPKLATAGDAIKRYAPPWPWRTPRSGLRPSVAPGSMPHGASART